MKLSDGENVYTLVCEMDPPILRACCDSTDWMKWEYLGIGLKEVGGDPMKYLAYRNYHTFKNVQTGSMLWAEIEGQQFVIGLHYNFSGF